MGFTDAVTGEGFKLLAEVDPPKGADTSEFLDLVLSIRGRVDGVVVTDGAYGLMRMTPLGPCRLLLDKNLDPLMALNGRDRNRLTFQGDLLSAWALGVRSVLIQDGGDPAAGDQPGARSAGDLGLDVMLQCVAALNSGKDLGGETLQGKPALRVGAALELSDDVNVNRKLAERLPELAEQGVGFLVLNPSYDVNILDPLAAAAEKAELKLFGSILLLKSVSMIRYLNSLPGVPNVPNEYLKRMRKAPVKVQGGMEIAASFLKDLEERCQGAVLAGLGWGPKLPEFLSLIGR